MNEKIWFEGYNDYKKCTATYDDDGKLKHFHTEIRDVELMDTTNIYEILNIHLSQRQTKTVEVCYSGGIDSEVALIGCVRNKIPVRAITMRVKYNDILMNAHDIYYSEKFCRENHIEQKFVDFDCVKMASGEYLKYVSPYNIRLSAAAPQLWLLTQCTGYVIIGGDYSWPWCLMPVISPHQHGYNMYYQAMKDNGIHGIGNMLGHSLDSNLHFIKSHIAVYNHEKHDPKNIIKLSNLKHDTYHHAGFENLEPRIKFGGVDLLPRGNYNDVCKELFGDSVSSISWGDKISEVIGSTNIRYCDRSN
jgi:hypothetical protein